MDDRKAAHVAAAFLLEAGGSISKLKLMYLAERLSLERRGYPMIYDQLVCMQYGPLLSATYNYTKYDKPWSDCVCAQRTVAGPCI